MAKNKQRTQCGAYSDETFGDTGKDKIRSVSWGPFEGNKTPPVLAFNADNLVNDHTFSGPATFKAAKVQRRNWQ